MSVSTSALLKLYNHLITHAPDNFSSSDCRTVGGEEEAGRRVGRVEWLLASQSMAFLAVLIKWILCVLDCNSLHRVERVEGRGF